MVRAPAAPMNAPSMEASIQPSPEGEVNSQILSLSWYFLAQLLQLPLKFHLSRLSRNEKPYWISSQNSEYPRIFRVKGANRNARKLLSTDLVNTNRQYFEFLVGWWWPSLLPGVFSGNLLLKKTTLTIKNSNLIRDVVDKESIALWMCLPLNKILSAMEPLYSERPRDWQNLFTITRLSYIEVLFHIF